MDGKRCTGVRYAVGGRGGAAYEIGARREVILRTGVWAGSRIFGSSQPGSAWSAGQPFAGPAGMFGATLVLLLGFVYFAAGDTAGGRTFGKTRLRLRLCRQILAAPLRHIETTGPPRLLAHLIDDVLTVSNGLLLAPMITQNLAIVIGVLAYLGYQSWPVLLALLLVLVV